MKKITFKIRGEFGLLKEIEKEKQGYLIILSGYPNLKLAANKCTFSNNSNIQWNITDLKTGFRFLLGNINETLKSCCQRCVERIDRYGLKHIIQMQNETLKKHNNVHANQIMGGY